MGLELEYIDGQTPLEEEEKQGLLVVSVTTRAELDEFEQLNIENAIEWTYRRKFTKEQIFTVQFVKELHKKMFDEVWRWAGEFRKSNKNIGVDWYAVPTQLQQLIDDCLYWIENKSFPDEEIAIRFSYRMVTVHCFANGNGRHSRLIADIVMRSVFGKPEFTWGNSDLTKHTDVRKKYIDAIKTADAGDIRQLLEFATS